MRMEAAPSVVSCCSHALCKVVLQPSKRHLTTNTIPTKGRLAPSVWAPRLPLFFPSLLLNCFLTCIHVMEQNKNRSHFDLLPLSVLVYSIPDRWTFLQLIVTVIVALGTTYYEVYETNNIHLLICDLYFQVHVLPREIMGLSTFRLSLWLLMFMSVQTVDRLLLLFTRFVLGDTARLGIPRPSIGPMELKKVCGKTPVLDVGTIAKIKSRDIKVISK